MRETTRERVKQNCSFHNNATLVDSLLVGCSLAEEDNGGLLKMDETVRQQKGNKAGA